MASQPTAAVPHRSSPSIHTNSARSSPALYIDIANEQRADKRWGGGGPPAQRHRQPQVYNNKLERPKERGAGKDSLAQGYSAALRPQVEAPVLNNTVDNRHSVEVTEQDLNTG